MSLDTLPAHARIIAFLRAINVGGHTVTMAALRAHFEALGLANVETFIASGNVIFDSAARGLPALERKIEKHLGESLGYEVKTFLRTESELAAIARYVPFDAKRIESAGAFCVGFLAEPLDSAARKCLLAAASDLDEFDHHGREIYWLSRVRQGESKFSNAVFEKATRARTTFRGFNTVKKLAAKLAGERS